MGVATLKIDILHTKPCQLLCGIDSLYITGGYHYEYVPDPDTGVYPTDQPIFETLDTLKASAKENRSPELLLVGDVQGLVQSYGSKRYSWVIQTKYFTLQISPHFKNPTIPPLNVQVRSYALWLLGLDPAIKKLNDYLQGLGFTGPFQWKPSRVDLCVDHETENYLPYVSQVAKTRSRQKQIITDCDQVLYVRFGKGDVQVRFYDKAREILNSQKLWFYDLWRRDPGVHPEGQSVYRIEFQLRRKALKEFSINSIDDINNKLLNLWSYLTKNWCSFIIPQADRHKYRQKPYPFWEQVRTAFDDGIHIPACRYDASSGLDGVQLSQSMVGMVLAYAALTTDKFDHKQHKQEITAGFFLKLCRDMLQKSGMTDEDLTNKFLEKIC